MDMLCFYRNFETKCHTIYCIIGAKKSARHYFNMLDEHGISIKRLSNEQKKEVDNLWGAGGVRNS
jgi:hypothetical protein